MSPRHLFNVTGNKTSALAANTIVGVTFNTTTATALHFSKAFTTKLPIAHHTGIGHKVGGGRPLLRLLFRHHRPLRLPPFNSTRLSTPPPPPSAAPRRPRRARTAPPSHSAPSPTDSTTRLSPSSAPPTLESPLSPCREARSTPPATLARPSRRGTRALARFALADGINLAPRPATNAADCTAVAAPRREGILSSGAPHRRRRRR